MSHELLPPLDQLDYTAPLVLDSSMIVAYRSCPRKFLYRYVNHLQTASNAWPLLCGGAFAKGLEVYRFARITLCLSHADAMAKVVEAVVIFWGDNPHYSDKPTEPRNLLRMIAVVEDYVVRFPTFDDNFFPLAQETGYEFSFAVELTPDFPFHPSGVPFIYSGRFDAIGYYGGPEGTGIPAFSDDKTTTRIDSTWMEQWTIRHQFIGYAWALRRLGYPHRHAVIRGVVVHKDDTVFVETPPIRFSDHVLDKFEQDLRVVLSKLCTFTYETQGGVRTPEQLRSSATLYPRHIGDACNAYMRKCAFAQVCFAAPANELTWLRAYDRVAWNPLERD